jgi:hypothetical protein
MAVTIEDLDVEDLRPSQQLVLQCPHGCEYSADKNDYFWMMPDQPFMCGKHKEPLVLFTKEMVYTVVKE